MEENNRLKYSVYFVGVKEASLLIASLLAVSIDVVCNRINSILVYYFFDCTYIKKQNLIFLCKLS